VQPASPDDRLADQQYVTVILRLVLDRHGSLVRGEVGGTEDGSWVRFGTSSGLLEAVERWLLQQQRAR
jgi:hypothetical protein